jgi:hypothetical protein
MLLPGYPPILSRLTYEAKPAAGELWPSRPVAPERHSEVALRRQRRDCVKLVYPIEMRESRA